MQVLAQAGPSSAGRSSLIMASHPSSAGRPSMPAPPYFPSASPLPAFLLSQQQQQCQPGSGGGEPSGLMYRGGTPSGTLRPSPSALALFHPAGTPPVASAPVAVAAATLTSAGNPRGAALFPAAATAPPSVFAGFAQPALPQPSPSPPPPALICISPYGGDPAPAARLCPGVETAPEGVCPSAIAVIVTDEVATSRSPLKEAVRGGSTSVAEEVASPRCCSNIEAPSSYFEPAVRSNSSLSSRSPSPSPGAEAGSRRMRRRTGSPSSRGPATADLDLPPSQIRIHLGPSSQLRVITVPNQQPQQQQQLPAGIVLEPIGGDPFATEAPPVRAPSPRTHASVRLGPGTACHVAGRVSIVGGGAKGDDAADPLADAEEGVADAVIAMHPQQQQHGGDPFPRPVPARRHDPSGSLETSFQAAGDGGATSSLLGGSCTATEAASDAAGPMQQQQQQEHVSSRHSVASVAEVDGGPHAVQHQCSGMAQQVTLTLPPPQPSDPRPGRMRRVSSGNVTLPSPAAVEAQNRLRRWWQAAGGLPATPPPEAAAAATLPAAPASSGLTAIEVAPLAIATTTAAPSPLPCSADPNQVCDADNVLGGSVCQGRRSLPGLWFPV